MKERVFNKHFSVTDQLFIQSCLLAKIPTTTRQASKFRMKKGLAFSKKAEASVILKEKGGKV